MTGLDMGFGSKILPKNAKNDPNFYHCQKSQNNNEPNSSTNTNSFLVT